MNIITKVISFLLLKLMMFKFCPHSQLSRVKEQSGNSTELDKNLVRKVQQGDKVAFDLLVIKYQHRIIQLVNRYVKDPS